MTTYFYDAPNDRYIDEETGAVVANPNAQTVSQARPDAAGWAQSQGLSFIPNTTPQSDPNWLRETYGDVRQGPDGNWYASTQRLNQMSGNQSSGIHGFLNGPGAVLLPAAGLAAAGIAAAGAGGLGAGASGLTEGGLLAGEQGFLPGSFELGASGYGGTAAAGLDSAAAAAAGGGAGAGLPSLQSLAQAGGTAGSAASRILSGAATAADWASVLGTLAQTGAGIYSGLQQSDATSALGDRILNMGAPSLARYEASFQPGFNLWDQPGYGDALNTSWETGLRRASATAGNPIENPGVMGELNKNIMGSLGLPALQNYRETNRAAGFGNVPQYAQIQQNAIGQQGSAWEAAGAGLESLLYPRANRPLNLNLGTALP